MSYGHTTQIILSLLTIHRYLCMVHETIRLTLLVMVYQQPANVTGNVGALSNALAVAIQQATSSQSGDGVNPSQATFSSRQLWT